MVGDFLILTYDKIDKLQYRMQDLNDTLHRVLTIKIQDNEYTSYMSYGLQSEACALDIMQTSTVLYY